MARIQPPRASSGTKSPACFFSIFAAFFSFGVSRGCFLVSLLLFFSLDIRSSPGSGGIFGQTRQRPALSFLQRSSAHAGHIRGLTFFRATRWNTPVKLPCPTLSYRRMHGPAFSVFPFHTCHHGIDFCQQRLNVPFAFARKIRVLGIS